jgi:predicted Zn-dependent peptidase
VNNISPINHTHHFPNGMTLVAELMTWCDSAACSLWLPCGSNYDPPGRLGLANLTCEMALRGAGKYESRQLVEAFENLGADREEALSNEHTVYSAATLASNLLPTLSLMADVARRPRFPEKQLDAGKQVIEQEIISLEDDPGQKVMTELSKNFLPAPWGLPTCGTLATLNSMTIHDVQRCHSLFYQPKGAILGVAGKFDWNQLADWASRLFGDWTPKEIPVVAETFDGKRTVHIPYDSQQTHIGVAYQGVPFSHPNYLLEYGAVNILSGGMSSRLFTEIREKRGLCYTVGASHFSFRDRGGVTCYCGTTADRAKESLNILLHELRRISEGVTEKEVELLKIRAKSVLVMQQESTESRVAGIVHDWYHLGRIRSRNEIKERINALDAESINTFLADSPEPDFYIATLGPEPLKESLKVKS